MNPITNANIEKFCQLCLRELPDSLYKPNHDLEKENITELIQNIGGSSFKKPQIVSSYPKEICHCCYIKLIALTSFRDKCLIAAGVLKMLLAEHLTSDVLRKLKNICRVCLKYCLEDNNNMLSCFEQCIGLQVLQPNTKNVDKVQQLLSDEHFPQKFCTNCTSKLQTFSAFRATAQQSNEYITNLLNDECETKELNEFDEMCQAIDDTKTEESNTSRLKIQIAEEDTIQLSNLLELKLVERPSVTPKTEELIIDEEKNNSNPVLNKIKKVKSRQKFLNCRQCEKKFLKLVMLEGHIKSAHEGLDRPFSCKQCPNTFRQYSALNRHIRLLHMPKQIKSEEVNIFASPKKQNHVCLVCVRQFKRKEILQEHMNSTHIPSRELQPFKCKICNKGFGSRRSMVRHEKNHSNERRFACEYCPKRYNCKTELAAHRERHTANPSLLCPFCKRAKSNIEELQKHIAMHELNRHHQCTICGHIFTTNCQLQEHLNAVHLKLRPFKCNYCEKTFATRRATKEHETVHDSTTRPIPCELCEMKFKNEKSLTMHITKEHSTLPKKIQKNNVIQTKKIQIPKHLL